MKKCFYKLNKPTMFIKRSDERFEQFKKFKKQNGFTPDQTWSLYYNIAIFVLPRLKHFRKLTIGIPMNFKTMEQWHQILDKMIFSFESILKYDDCVLPEQYSQKYSDSKQAITAYTKDLQQGFELFGKYFLHLWW